jgi:hypothetical protein
MMMMGWGWGWTTKGTSNGGGTSVLPTGLYERRYRWCDGGEGRGTQQQQEQPGGAIL